MPRHHGSQQETVVWGAHLFSLSHTQPKHAGLWGDMEDASECKDPNLKKTQREG